MSWRSSGWLCSAGLLLMGPGAGTAILNGVGFGFANQVPLGPVGIVSAAGTGLQEVSTLLAKHGLGLSQAVGTGGRYLSQAVGGLMFFSAMDALAADPPTELIILINKPPDAEYCTEAAGESGRDQKTRGGVPVRRGCAAIPPCECGFHPHPGGMYPALLTLSMRNPLLILPRSPPAKHARLAPGGRCPGGSPLSPGENTSAGLYSGGTLCYEVPGHLAGHPARAGLFQRPAG